jgi:hypothetical protein
MLIENRTGTMNVATISPRLRIPAFVVIGGGEIGAGYVRQLLRAVRAGRLETDRIVVVDRDPGCAAAADTDSRLRVAVADWSAWLEAGLDDAGPEAHLVPYHWAPHLLVDWLAGQVRRAGGVAERGGEIPARGVPFERETQDGDRALSYATWVCPPTCIEPARCPHTRGPKDWSLAGDLAAGRPEDPFDDRIVFRCLHLLYGVGTVPVRDVLAARDRAVLGLGRGRRRYLVATASHCHALAAALIVRPGRSA